MVFKDVNQGGDGRIEIVRIVKARQPSIEVHHISAG